MRLCEWLEPQFSQTFKLFNPIAIGVNVQQIASVSNAYKGDTMQIELTKNEAWLLAAIAESRAERAEPGTLRDLLFALAHKINRRVEDEECDMRSTVGS